MEKIIISLIAALDSKHAIGKKKALPWYLPADLKRFKELTMGHPIIMGRKTYESIGKPLTGRANIVLTREARYEAAGCKVVHSVEQALEAARNAPNDSDEVFVIGGAEIFREFLPRADKMYLTLIDHDFGGDVFFPEFDKTEWREVTREPHVPDEKNPYPYTFSVLLRNNETARN